MQSQNLKKDLLLKFKMISRTSFVFMIAFLVYEWRAYIDVCYGGTYPKKPVKLDFTSRVFKLKS